MSVKHLAGCDTRGGNWICAAGCPVAAQRTEEETTMAEPTAARDAGTQLVRQAHTWGCGVAALAMVTGETYDEVRTWILDNWVYNVLGRETPDGWLTEHGVTQYVLDWYLGEHGFAWRRLYRAWTEADSWPPKPFAPVHVAQVVQPSGNAHFVVLTADGRVLDPVSDTPRSLTDWEQINFVQGVWRRPSFDDLLNDPTQQLDCEGVVLQAVLDERERDRLRSEGWRACTDHLQREYHRAADRWPGKVPVVMLDGEQLWFLANDQNPFRPRVAPPTESESGR